MPLVIALALSESELCAACLGDNGAGAIARSPLAFDIADGAEEGTNISAGGAARVRDSEIAAAAEGSSERANVRILGLEGALGDPRDPCSAGNSEGR